MKTLKFLFSILLLLTSTDVKSQTTHVFEIEDQLWTYFVEYEQVVNPGDLIRIEKTFQVRFIGNLYVNGVHTKYISTTQAQLYSENVDNFNFDENNEIFIELKNEVNGTTLEITLILDENTANINSFEQEVQVNVYPNPFIDNINIDGFIETWELYDLSGRLIKSDSPNSQNINIQLDFVKPGTYILLINRQKKVTIVKS